MNAKTVSLFVLAAALVALPFVLNHKQPEEPQPKPQPIAVKPDPVKPIIKQSERRIQVALLLDTSSSMDGLIDQAKSQLWKIVNELGAARRNGERPILEIALYEYGKSGLEPASGFVRQILPFTTDLDVVSEKLFELTTNGGEEFCGRVIQSATFGLSWSKASEDLKLIFIAGNEPFTQGDVDYRVAIAAAQAKGITVNTIFCGPSQEGIATGWADGAKLAEGKFLTIDQDVKVEYIAAPQDEEIARLGSEMNRTYLPYGNLGSESYARQKAQDANAVGSSQGSWLGRAASKASANYSNPTWDLVDAAKDGKLDWTKIENESLPEEMRKLDTEGKKAYVEARAKERVEMQKRIAELDAARNKFVAEKRKEMGENTNNTLDQAMIAAVRTQASKIGYQFE